MNRSRTNRNFTVPAHRQSRPLRKCIAPMSLGLALAGICGATTAQAADTLQWAPGRILVQPRPGLPEAELEKILAAHGGKSVGTINGIGVHVVELPANASEKAVANLLAKNPHLKFAELDMLLPPSATVNDPYYSNEWHLTKIGAPTAWDSSIGSGIVIAILDSGVDGSHPDLAPSLVAGWNFYDNNSNTADVAGHGTNVAGVAAAASNNGIGVAGVAGSSQIMPIRVTDTLGMGYVSMMASGLTWAADNGARVANLSFAPTGYATVQSAAQYMKNKGGVVVTAAGNYGVEDTTPPTNTMLTVSATEANDAITSWSSYGNFVDVSAPGETIWTTVKGGSYSYVAGTSFSTPLTAGVIALIMAANPALGADDVENVLFTSAHDLGTAGWDKSYGYGRVDAAAAVLAAKDAVATDTSAPSVSFSSPASSATVSGLVMVDVNATDNVGVSRVDLTVNGTLLASDTTSPYGFSWDSTAVPSGNATLTAYAYDAAGNYSSSSVTVNVATSDTIAPTAVISNPAANAKVSGTISIAASASDNIGVTNLSLYIDGVLKSSASGASLSLNWNTRKISSGSHTIKVEAKDAAGNLGSQSIQVLK